MSRADAPNRILDAAIALGTAEGVAALSLQGVATAAGVSKALVLYHFDGKDALLAALAERLVAQDLETLAAAAAAADVLEAWRDAVGATAPRARRALLLALLREAPLRPLAAAWQARRATAATRLGTAMLASAQLTSRIGAALLGRVVLRQLDGLAMAGDSAHAEALDAELDATALAVLGLGR